jgi:hypothetical protein
MFEFFSIKKYYNEEENKILEHYYYDNQGRFKPVSRKWSLIINIILMVVFTFLTIVFALLVRSPEGCRYFVIIR